MENTEKVLNPQESLRVIRETIDIAKSKLSNNGFHFLLWGWLVVLGSLADYYMTTREMPYPLHIAWIIMPVIGMPVALVYKLRQDKSNPTPNVVRDWHGYIWMAFGISMFLTFLLTSSAGITPIPFLLILAGFATFLSGILLRFKPLVVGGIIFWVGALISVWLPGETPLLVNAAATVAGYLVPGYWLNRQFRSSHV